MPSTFLRGSFLRCWAARLTALVLSSLVSRAPAAFSPARLGAFPVDPVNFASPAALLEQASQLAALAAAEEQHLLLAQARARRPQNAHAVEVSGSKSAARGVYLRYADYGGCPMYRRVREEKDPLFLYFWSGDGDKSASGWYAAGDPNVPTNTEYAEFWATGEDLLPTGSGDSGGAISVLEASSGPALTALMDVSDMLRKDLLDKYTATAAGGAQPLSTGQVRESPSAAPLVSPVALADSSLAGGSFSLTSSLSSFASPSSPSSRAHTPPAGSSSSRKPPEGSSAVGRSEAPRSNAGPGEDAAGQPAQSGGRPANATSSAPEAEAAVVAVMGQPQAVAAAVAQMMPNTSASVQAVPAPNKAGAAAAGAAEGIASSSSRAAGGQTPAHPPAVLLGRSNATALRAAGGGEHHYAAGKTAADRREARKTEATMPRRSGSASSAASEDKLDQLSREVRQLQRALKKAQGGGGHGSAAASKSHSAAGKTQRSASTRFAAGDGEGGETRASVKDTAAEERNRKEDLAALDARLLEAQAAGLTAAEQKELDALRSEIAEEEAARQREAAATKAKAVEDETLGYDIKPTAQHEKELMALNERLAASIHEQTVKSQKATRRSEEQAKKGAEKANTKANAAAAAGLSEAAFAEPSAEPAAGATAVKKGAEPEPPLREPLREEEAGRRGEPEPVATLAAVPVSAHLPEAAKGKAAVLSGPTEKAAAHEPSMRQAAAKDPTRSHAAVAAPPLADDSHSLAAKVPGGGLEKLKAQLSKESPQEAQRPEAGSTRQDVPLLAGLSAEEAKEMKELEAQFEASRLELEQSTLATLEAAAPRRGEAAGPAEAAEVAGGARRKQQGPAAFVLGADSWLSAAP
eukprot:TRINITY_DN16097_c0_g1_i1.p1 TRINITY_DN16097_c0_g1~~TRINITY_DN16097_c0_g1_i1.p1  ORF type:complete len:864 (-),score=236.05 TRINITY_DN16097_c0_g1_i1:50-2641(-)